METRSSRARKGLLAGDGREHLLREGEGLASQAAGRRVGSAWTPGNSLTFLLPGPARLGSSLIFLAVLSQVRAHLSTSPRCTTGSLLLHSSYTARKCLHKSSPHCAKSVWTSLDQSTESPKFLINSGSAPTLTPPTKARRFFPDLPQVSCVSWDVLSRSQEEKARQSVGSTPEARLKTQD